MCSPTLAIGAALAMGGTALKANAISHAGRRQFQADQAAQQHQSQFQSQVNSVVNSEVNQYRPQQRIAAQQNRTSQEVARMQGILASAKAAGQERIGGNVNGAVSNAYTTLKAKALADQGSRATQLAMLLGKVRSPNLFRADEAVIRANTQQKINTIGNFAHGTAGADAIGINGAGYINPFVTGAADLMTAIGSAGITSGISGGTGAKVRAGNSAGNSLFRFT